MMREIVGNLWDFQRAGAILVIAVNSEVSPDTGKAIMGKGIAREARDRLWNIDAKLGAYITQYGSRCFRFPMDVTESKIFEWTLITMPTKVRWREPADPMLIAQSCAQLVEMVDKFGYSEIHMVRPGVGNGKLSWEQVVKPLIDPLLDNRFIVVSKESD